MIKKIFRTILIAVAGVMAVAPVAMGAAAGGIPWDQAPDKVNDQAALQRGAKLFVNYCLGCHSAAFMRYNRLQDIGLSEEQIKSNLLFATDNAGDLMVSAIDPKEAKAWFGKNPPDLTLIARSRAGAGGSGADYLYTLLRSYYPDSTKPTGWNNLAYPDIGMPNVLWELQGVREPEHRTVQSHGHEVSVVSGWKQVTPGMMTPLEFDNAVADLVAYLQWMGEPAQETRIRIGVWVLLFLLIAMVITWRLNAAFWREVK